MANARVLEVIKSALFFVVCNQVVLDECFTEKKLLLFPCRCCVLSAFDVRGDGGLQDAEVLACCPGGAILWLIPQPGTRRLRQEEVQGAFRSDSKLSSESVFLVASTGDRRQFAAD